jgi:fluoride ion exporter CrcB/FEX
MGLSPLDKVFWLAGFLGQIALLGVLAGRGRVRRFPFFTLFIAFATLENIVDFLVFRYASRSTYFWTYWSMGITEILLQVGIVVDMAREVLRPTGTWVHDARNRFLVFGSIGAVVAAALSFAVNPKIAPGPFAWTIRVNTFTSLLLGELVLAMFLTAQKLGLQWRNWVMGLGQGVMIWVSISLCLDTVHSYWGEHGYFILDYLRMAAFLCALALWCVALWREEPERKPLPPEMMKYLVSFHSELDYTFGAIHPEEKPR